MCVCMRVHIHIYIYIYMHTYIHAYDWFQGSGWEECEGVIQDALRSYLMVSMHVYYVRVDTCVCVRLCVCVCVT